MNTDEVKVSLEKGVKNRVHTNLYENLKKDRMEFFRLQSTLCNLMDAWEYTAEQKKFVKSILNDKSLRIASKDVKYYTLVSHESDLTAYKAYEGTAKYYENELKKKNYYAKDGIEYTMKCDKPDTYDRYIQLRDAIKEDAMKCFTHTKDLFSIKQVCKAIDLISEGKTHLEADTEEATK